MTESGKRTAYEPLERLARPTPYDPGMKRPASTVAGVVIVLIGVLASVLWMIEVALHWSDLAQGVDEALVDVSLSSDLVSAGLVVFLVVGGVIIASRLALALLVLRGVNWARVVVMVFSVVSISSAFVAWWVEGQEITLRTTLPSLGLDILVLLALSSRSSAAYARRNQRR